MRTFGHHVSGATMVLAVTLAVGLYGREQWEVVNDLYYVKNHTLFLDILILLETVKAVLFGRGAG